jgi:hypothetical protein
MLSIMQVPAAICIEFVVLHRAVSTLLLLLAAVASASPVKAETVVFWCDTPRGMRANYGDPFKLGTPRGAESQTITWLKDGFSGINLSMIWRSEQPQVLMVSWGDTDAGGVLRNNPVWKESQQFKAWKVLFRDVDRIQAVPDCSFCPVEVLTLFPKVGFVTLTGTKYYGALTAYAAQCRRLPQ